MVKYRELKIFEFDNITDFSRIPLADLQHILYRPRSNLADKCIRNYRLGWDENRGTYILQLLVKLRKTHEKP